MSSSSFKLLLEERKKGNLKGESLLQLGRQHTSLRFKDAIKLMKKAKVPIPKVTVELSFNPNLKEKGYISDQTFFALLGFKKIHSVDVSDYESSTFVHDLNLPLPKQWSAVYDVIIDGGTSEHVFSLPQVLSNIHKMLKANGQIIHLNPSTNHVDHGFYMFSPSLFYNYYKENGYQVLTSYFFKYRSSCRGKWKVYDYQPGMLDDLSFGGFGKGMWGIFLVARKNAHATYDRIPQQAEYYFENREKNQQSRKISLLRQWVRKSPVLRRLAKILFDQYSAFKRNFIRLKKIGNY